MRLGSWLAVLGVLGLLASPALVRAQVASPPPSERYEPLIDAAVDAFARGDWALSRALFERAQAIEPNARALRGLGMSDFNLHAYARATAELEGALESTTRALDTELRAQVDQLLLRARPHVARVTLSVSPAHARLLIDDAPPLRDARQRLLLELGVHTLRVEAERYLSTEQRVAFPSPGDYTLQLSARPSPKSLRGAELDSERQHERSLAERVALIAGVLAIGVGTATRLSSDHRFDALDRRCRAMAGCLPGEADLGPTRRLERASYATFGVGAALTVTAFVMWLFDQRGLAGPEHE